MRDSALVSASRVLSRAPTLHTQALGEPGVDHTTVKFISLNDGGLCENKTRMTLLPYLGLDCNNCTVGDVWKRIDSKEKLIHALHEPSLDSYATRAIRLARGIATRDPVDANPGTFVLCHKQRQAEWDGGDQPLWFCCCGARQRDGETRLKGDITDARCLRRQRIAMTASLEKTKKAEKEKAKKRDAASNTMKPPKKPRTGTS